MSATQCNAIAVALRNRAAIGNPSYATDSASTNIHKDIHKVLHAISKATSVAHVSVVKQDVVKRHLVNIIKRCRDTNSAITANQPYWS